MSRRTLGRWGLALGAALWAGTVGSTSFGGTWTGNVETDLPSTDQGVLTLVNPRYPSVNPEQYVAANGLSTGWGMKDIRLKYDQTTDTMVVGVNFFGIAGDADSDGNPGVATVPRGLDLPNLGGRESITIGFELTGDGTPTVLAGVSSEKSQAGNGLLGFSLARYNDQGGGLSSSYGTPLTDSVGTLYFNPSASSPDFLFSISNFSKLPGLDFEKGFGLIAFAGSVDDVVAAEESVRYPRVAAGRIPEPATVLGWTVLIGAGATWRAARRRTLRTR